MTPCHPEADASPVKVFGIPYERYCCAQCNRTWEHRTEPRDPDKNPASDDPEWVEVAN